ncbi:MAG: TIR domain-containing protein [Sphingomicrobium sp.]
MTSTELPGDGPAARRSVFLSYARHDAPRAKALVAALTDAGVTVWWDGLIEAGAGFTESIERALETADAVIVLWSAASVGSDWVRDEAARGRDRHRLIPITLDGSQPPLGFRQYQTLDFSSWRGRADAAEVAGLLQRVGALSAIPSDLPAPLAMPRSRRTILAGGAAAVLLAGGGVVAWRELRPTDNGGSPSIAVIPFGNLSKDPQQAFFSDGLTEAIRSDLARNDGLKVLAAISSDTARAHAEDAVTVARRLGVGFLLEGTVQQAGRLLRISADLIDGKTGFSRWTQRFDRPIDDVFDVQSEIARTVAETLSLRLGAAKPVPGGTTNVAAYESYLRGRQLFHESSDEATDRAALAQFELAISEDPKFAMAFAARSRSLAGLATQYAKSSELKSLYDAAIASAEQAVALAPTLAEAQLALGFAWYTGKLNIVKAAAPFDRAYALGKGNADIVLLYALYCSRAGRADEARSAIARAVALDPLNPRAHRAEGSIAYAARRYTDALPPLNRALELKPDLANTHYYVGAALLMTGNAAAARDHFLKESNSDFGLSGLAIAERQLGHTAESRQAFERLISVGGDAGLYQQAEVLAQWGDIDQAITRLERAKAVGDSGLIYLTTDPLLDPLRQAPRFIALASNLAVD